MPSFDVVCDVDKHELSNAVDQAARELETRFDFRGVEAGFSLDGLSITQRAPSAYQLEQMLEILRKRLVARGIDLRSMDLGDVQTNLSEARRVIAIKDGLDKTEGKKVIASLKASKLKVSAQIQDNQVRVSGKKRDDLQAAIAHLKQADLELPLQFTNFRD